MTSTVQIGSDVAVEFPLASGETPAAASWRLEDETGATVSAEADVPPEGRLPGLVRVTVPGTLNATPGLRLVRLRYAEPGGVMGEGGEFFYRVTAAQELAPAVNSFAAYNRLLGLAAAMVELDAFLAASRADRVVALETAYRRLVTLRVYEPGNERHQNRLHDVPWAGAGIELETLSADELAALDPRLGAALQRAQIAEADAILRGDGAAESSRLAGVEEATIGETTQKFRRGKPLRLSISAAAMRELRGLVSFTPRIAR